MTDFIRELFESEISGSCKPYTLPEKIREKIKKRDDIYEILKKRIGDENDKLFEEYIDLCSYIHREDEYFAFSCGIKFVIRMLSGVFFGK